MSEKDFYLVWSPQGSSSPTVRHANAFDATREAERMARNHAGKEFYVLHAVRKVVKNDVQIVNLAHDCAEEDMPF